MSIPEFDHLLSFCIEYAKRRLDKQSAFYPFGASMKGDGSASADGIPRTKPGAPQPSTQEVMDIYLEMYQTRAKAGEIKAAAICWDGVITLDDGKKVEAITLVLEHQNKQSYFVYMPYEKKASGEFEYGEMVSITRDVQIFE